MSDDSISFRVTYKPEGAKVRSWVVDPMRDIELKDFSAIQKVTGIRGIPAFMEGLGLFDPDAVRGLLWLLLKRELSTLSYDSLSFTLAEIDIQPEDEMSPAETRRRLEALEAQGNLSDAGRRALDQLILQGVEAATLDADEQVVADPKA